jgi:ech hydrogenase subunit C
MTLLKSPWVLHFSCTSCNGCDIEVLAALTPRYDLERFGILNKGNPKFADVLLITGAVNPRTEKAVKNLYGQIPEPKAVIVVGSCGSTGGVFHDCYNIRGGVDTAIPVDVYVPGCPARPEAIIDGVVKALGLVKAKLEAAENGGTPPGPAQPPAEEDVEVAEAEEETAPGEEGEKGAPAAKARGGEGQ